MKTLIAVALVLLSALLFVSCSRINVEPGTEVVLVSHPYIWGKGGVLPEPMTSGSEYVALSTKGVPFNITPISYEEHFDNLITSDNTPIDFSAYVNIRINAGATPVLFNKFKESWYKNNIQVQFRTLVRDRASQYKMFTLSSDRAVLNKIQTDIFNELTAYAKRIELPITILHVTIGAVTPPKSVLEETEKTAAQNQGVLTEAARTLREKARKSAEHEKALSDTEYRTTAGMSVPEYLHLRALEIEKEKTEMVRGKQNVTVIMGSGGTGIQPTYDTHPR